MRSIRELYRIGRGPSSSHTMGPETACRILLSRFPTADRYRVTLFGSLALTGRGHGTDRILRETLSPLDGEILFKRNSVPLPHPNTMEIELWHNTEKLADETVCSIGGGAIRLLSQPETEGGKEVYPHKTFSEITSYCAAQHLRISEYALICEGNDILDYLTEVLSVMRDAVKRGLSAEGELPGVLHTQRRASSIFNRELPNETPQERQTRLISAYAFAACEENAAGNRIVTAPTCGASGILPAVLIYAGEQEGFSDRELLNGLLTAGVCGNVIKENASISGAECGCQAEVGSACSMAAMALAELYKMTLSQIDYAGEIAMEHHLGLTCDPIAGLVQIPCIERNAVAAMRAWEAKTLARFLSDSRKISFDLIIKTMLNTGRDLPLGYRETSTGGLAKYYPIKKG